MWTSLIQYADYVWLACRTDPEAPRHKGLSILIVPTDAAGFSWTPVRTVAGTTTSATYYSDVRVPASALVGEENQGWRLITNQLNHERVALTSAAPVRRALREVTDWARATKLASGQRVIDAEWVQLNLARVHAKSEFLKLVNWRIAAEAGPGLGPAAASATKVFGTEFATEAYRLLMEVLGANAYVRDGSAGAVAVRPDRADAPFRADPDLRRRHERGAARPHRRRGAGASRRPPLRPGESHGLHAERSRARTRRPQPEDSHRPADAGAAARG